MRIEGKKNLCWALRLLECVKCKCIPKIIFIIWCYYIYNDDRLRKMREKKNSEKQRL